MDAFVETRKAMNVDEYDVDVADDDHGIVDYLETRARGSYLVPPPRDKRALRLSNVNQTSHRRASRLVTLLCRAPGRHGRLFGARRLATRDTVPQRHRGERGLSYSDSIDSGFGNGNAGIYATDFDKDGWTDLLAIGDERPALFRNDGGTYMSAATRFRPLNRTFKSAAVVDYDGDGWRTSSCCRPTGRSSRPQRRGLFRTRRRRPRQRELSARRGGRGLRRRRRPGHLPLPVGQLARASPPASRPTGPSMTTTAIPTSRNENTGGEFERVDDAGIDGDRWSLAASFTDLTGDGHPDVHVANDYNSDVLYVSRGDGTFEKRNLRGATERNGMASEVADVTGDGRQDVFVTNIYLPISPQTMGHERYERVEYFLVRHQLGPDEGEHTHGQSGRR